MNDAASAAPTYQQVIAAWNAQADEHNQWSELGEDEKVEWAVACAKTTPPAVVEPLTDEQIEALPLWKRFVGLWPETRREIVRTIERHHGIKGGQHDPD